MHNANFLTFTHYVKHIYASTRLKTRDRLTRVGGASTISALSMTYSTPACLVRVGQGVSFVYFSFSYGVHLAQLKHLLTSLEQKTGTLGARLKPEAPTCPFWPQVVPALLFCFSDLVPAFPTHFSQLTSSPAPACTSSPTPCQPYQPPVAGSPADDTNLACCPPSPLTVS